MCAMNNENKVEVPAHGSYLVVEGEVREIGLQQGYAGPHVHLAWDMNCGSEDPPDMELIRKPRP